MKDDKNSRYDKLRSAEIRYDELLQTLQRSHQEDSYIPSNNLKEMVVDTFDGMKETVLELLAEDSEGSSEDCNNNSHDARQKEIPKDDLNLLCPPNVTSAQPMARPHGRTVPETLVFRRNSRRAADVSSTSFDTVKLTDEELDADAVSSTQSDSRPIPDVDTRGPQATREEVEFQGEVVSMLTRMSQGLKGFFQWLKTKVKSLASKAWEKVCNTFNAMFTFLQNACQRFRGSGNRADTYTRLYPA